MVARGPLDTFALLSALISPQAVAAQTVRGEARDAVSGAPVAEANLTLLLGDRVMARAMTDSAGRFTLRATSAGAGAWLLRVRRLGYAPYTSEPLALRPGQDTLITIRLRPLAVALDTVVVAAERSRRLVREGFYDRRAKRIGVFRTPEELEAQNPLFVDDLFWGMGILIRQSRGRPIPSRNRVVSPSNPSCSLTVALDGFVITEAWTELVHAQDVEAVEVYTSPAGVPVWLQGIVSSCGAVVLWTKGSRD